MHLSARAVSMYRTSEETEREKNPKQNPMQYFRTVTDSIRERGLAKKLAEQKGTKYKIILEQDTWSRSSSYQTVWSMCPNSYLWDCLLLASGRGRWRTAFLTVNVCLKIIQHTRLKDTLILVTNLLMDLLKSLQWFFIEIICYRSVKV